MLCRVNKACRCSSKVTHDKQSVYQSGEKFCKDNTIANVVSINVAYFYIREKDQYRTQM
jgi:hypothetical protein